MIILSVFLMKKKAFGLQGFKEHQGSILHELVKFRMQRLILNRRIIHNKNKNMIHNNNNTIIGESTLRSNSCVYCFKCHPFLKLIR